MINIDSDNANAIREDINDLFYGCTTQQYENYDIVTVDLDNNRDYPIYIGTDFTNEQGMMTLTHLSHVKMLFPIRFFFDSNHDIPPFLPLHWHI